MNDIKIFLVTMEIYPFSKEGGISDYSYGLSKVLKKRGVDIRIISPKYNFVNQQIPVALNFVANYQVKLGTEIFRSKLWVTSYDEVPIYFIDNSIFFARDRIYGCSDEAEQAVFFDKAVLEALPLIGFEPDIVQCNDWQCGLIPLLLKTKYTKFPNHQKIKSLLMLHNINEHGIFEKKLLHRFDFNWEFFVENGIDFFGMINFIKAGTAFADTIGTVSPTYAKELDSLNERHQIFYQFLCEFQKNLDGIVNGIDVKQYNPAIDPLIFANYDDKQPAMKKANKKRLQELLDLPVREDIPIISWVSRVNPQKGIALVQVVMEYLIEENMQFVMIGDGKPSYEKFFEEYSKRCHHKFRYLKYDEALAHKIYAGSDMFVLPSQYEPCGLSQQISMRYGTVPIVRATGGLIDTVQEFDEKAETGTGFLFKDYNPWAFLYAVRKALSYYHQKKNLWDIIIDNCLRRDCSWDARVDEYIALYEKTISQDNSPKFKILLDGN